MPLTITVAEIEDGMVLHSPIKNNSGQVLLSAGMTLMKSHANILKTWNIYSLTVEGGEEEIQLVISDEEIIRAKEMLAEKFLWIPQNEYENELYELALMNVIEKNQKKKK
jgi:hypothetical protein